MWNPLRMEYGQWLAGIRFDDCWIIRNGVKVDISKRYKTKKQAIAICERLNKTRPILDQIEDYKIEQL